MKRKEGELKKMRLTLKDTCPIFEISKQHNQGHNAQWYIH